MKKKITAILMTAALMLTMAACAGNSTADTGVESSASSAVSSKPVSNTSSTAASSAKPSASAKPTAAPTAAPTAVPTATPKPKEKVWVVDTPAQAEQGHWEEDYWMGSDWVYQCNACGTQFSTVDEFESHSDYEWELGNDHGSYTMTSGEMYKHYTGEKYWVVDIPAQDEVGHWEYR